MRVSTNFIRSTTRTLKHIYLPPPGFFEGVTPDERKPMMHYNGSSHSTVSFAATNSSKRASEDSSTTTQRVAVGQMTATGNQEANFQTCRKLAEEAQAKGCAMLFLPECFAFIGENQLEEKGPDADHLYNCHVVVNATGEVVASYRKVHLFNVEVENGPILMESKHTTPGKQVVVCDSPAGKLGLTVCYDLRFPELYQKLVFELGAQILLVPSAFTVKTGEAHWELLLRARAVETQCYVIAAAQAGKHNTKRESYGQSVIIDPWGRIVGQLADRLATGIAIADIDLVELQQVRTRMPIAEHRKQGRACLGLPERSELQAH